MIVLTNLCVASQAVVYDGCVAFSLRQTVGKYFHCRICVGSMQVDDLTVSEYLRFKEKLVSKISSDLLFLPTYVCFRACNRKMPPNGQEKLCQWQDIVVVMHAYNNVMCGVRVLQLHICQIVMCWVQTAKEILPRSSGSWRLIWSLSMHTFQS